MGLATKWSLVFCSKELGTLLPDFKDIAKEASYPAIRVLLYRFLTELFQKPTEYGITDKMKIGPPRSWSFVFVFMGKLIEISATDVDIDVCDEDEQIWSVGSFSVEATNKEAFSGFCDLLTNFVSGQDPQEIIGLVAEDLKKEKVYHLAPAVRSFYKV